LGRFKWLKRTLCYEASGAAVVTEQRTTESLGSKIVRFPLSSADVVGEEEEMLIQPARHDAKQDKRLAIATAHLGHLPAGIPSTPAERGFDACPCPKDCVLHGSCHLYVAYHGRKGRLPRCER
jgi:hypothetical protein